MNAEESKPNLWLPPPLGVPPILPGQEIAAQVSPSISPIESPQQKQPHITAHSLSLTAAHKLTQECTNESGPLPTRAPLPDAGLDWTAPGLNQVLFPSSRPCTQAAFKDPHVTVQVLKDRQCLGAQVAPLHPQLEPRPRSHISLAQSPSQHLLCNWGN